MRLLPGPIPALTTDWYDPTPEPPQLAAFVSDQLAELDQVESDLDDIIDPNAVIDDALPIDDSDADLAIAETTLGDVQGYVATWPIAEIDAAQNEGDEGILNVYSVIPAEAFEPVPDPQVLTPGEAAPPDVNPVEASIANTVREGAADFYPGEQYAITVRIQPGAGGRGVYAGVPIVGYAWKDNAPQPQWSIGSTDQYGNLTFRSYFGDDSIGQWGVTFYAQAADGSLTAGPTFYWTVQARPGAIAPPIAPPIGGPTTPTTPPQPTAAPIRVSLQNFNTTRPPNHFAIGDSWRLTVQGPPNSDVVIGGQANGDTLAPVTVGQTDPAGLFSLDGQMSYAELGTWVEEYTVGGVKWNGLLGFTVGLN